MRIPFSDVQIILLVHIVTIVSIVLNIPIVRQVSGFFYLVFIPGFAILKILKLDEEDLTFVVLFSVGLSIACLMFAGLMINEFLPLLGFSKPLSAIPLTITLMGLTIIFLLIGYRSDLGRVANIDSLVHITRKTLFKAFVFVLPLLLGITGALYNNATLLLLMIAVAAILWALSVFSRKFLPIKLCPFAISVIGLSLLLHTTLISRYNLGNDINGEYYTFKMTEVQGHWAKPGILTSESTIANYQSGLSVTVLPTIYSVLINLSGELVFKLIFAFFLSLVPLAIYRVCESQIGEKSYALLSAFLFMSMRYSFFGTEPLAVGRQIVAELFFMLSVILIVDKKIELRRRKILFVISSFALIVSHYSVAYIYLLYVVFAFILSYRHLRKDICNILDRVAVLFIFTTIFSWYVFVSDSPTLGLATRIENVYTSFLVDLLNPAARSSTVFTYLNPSASSSFAGLIHRYLVYVQSLFIVVGIVTLVVKRKRTLFTREYQNMSILALLILLASFAVPRLAPTLNLTRFYGITLLLLAPFFALGGVTIFELIKKGGLFIFTKSRMPPNKSQEQQLPRNLSLKIVTLILIVTFLFQIGFINHITGSDSLSISLDLDNRRTTTNIGTKTSFYEVYTPEQDVFSARWYSNNIDRESLGYADSISKGNVLTAYALMDRDRIRMLSNATALQAARARGVYIYLRLLNVFDNIVVTEHGLLNTSEISFLLSESNKIYSNSASEIYHKP